MKWRFAAVMIAFLMVAMAFAVVASAEDNSINAPELSQYDNNLFAEEELDRQAEQGVTPSRVTETAV